jgi:hypothetical protein
LFGRQATAYALVWRSRADGRREMQSAAIIDGRHRPDGAPDRGESAAATARLTDADAGCGEQPGAVRRARRKHPILGP